MGTSDYREFVLWTERVAVELVRTKEHTRLTTFLREANAVHREIAELLDSLARCLRGDLGGVALDLLRWARRHPDPLVPIRERVRDLRAAYADVVRSSG